jgi:hypothetical protein
LKGALRSPAFRLQLTHIASLFFYVEVIEKPNATQLCEGLLG